MRSVQMEMCHRHEIYFLSSASNICRWFSSLNIWWPTGPGSTLSNQKKCSTGKCIVLLIFSAVFTLNSIWGQCRLSRGLMGCKYRAIQKIYPMETDFYPKKMFLTLTTSENWGTFFWMTQVREGRQQQVQHLFIAVDMFVNIIFIYSLFIMGRGVCGGGSILLNGGSQWKWAKKMRRERNRERRKMLKSKGKHWKHLCTFTELYIRRNSGW